MSIFASTLSFDDEWDPPGPLVYRGSHLWPDPNDRGGSFDLAHIPGYVTHNGEALDEMGERLWPYLRVSLIGAAEDENRDTVLLDLEQVRQLHTELGQWLERAEEKS